MKKITFLLVAMLAFCWQGHAQFTENFESGVPGAFTETQDAEAIAWGACSGSLGGQTCPINGSTSATFYRASYTSAVTSLTTPIMDLSAGGFRLKFVHSQLDWGGDQNTLLVEISIDGGGTWTTIEDFTTSIASPTSELYLLDTYTTTAATQIRFTGTTNYGYAVVLDDVVVEPIPTCTPAVVDSSTVVDDCGNSQFSVDVVVSTVGDGTSITDGLGGSFPVVAGTVTAGPYTNGDTVTLTVEHSDPACNFSLGDFETGCTLPGEVCENSIIVGALPYTTTDDTANYGDDYTSSPGASGCGTTSSYLNGDDVVYSYTATADTSINVSMTPTASWSGIFVYTDCADIGVNCVAGSANSGTSERNFDLTVTNGTTYYFVISTFASPQSTGYTLNITENTCTAVTATYDVVDDCDVSGGFYIDVNVTDMGSATALTVSDDQGNPSQPLTAIGTLQFGPYVNGTDVVITIDDDNDDDSCTVTSSAITQTVCPPANDTCASAEVAPVGLGSCGTSVTGHNAGATDSGVAQAGCATATYSGGDVWYRFDMPAGETEIEYTRSASVFSTTQVELYSGTCGALVEEGCTTSATASFTGLTSEATYYLRIYDWGNNDIGSFTFCLNTPPTCPVPTSLNATNITVDSADLEWTDNAGASAWDIEWGTNGFTPTETPNIEDTTNPHPLGGLSASTSYDYYVRADCGGGDTSPWVGPYTFTTADPPPACGGNFYDDGGISSNYSNSANITTTICPDVPGDAVNVTFTFFSTENSGSTGCYDGLTIHDGPDASAPTINPTTGTIWCWDRNDATPNGTGDLQGMTISSTDASGCLTFVFTSDSGVNREGWEATVGCAPLSLEDYGLTGFTYFPNPVNNTLSLRGVKDIQNVAVYNMLGQEVLRTAPNTVDSDLDMSGLQSGTYFVKVMIENTTKTIKVIKK
ncbi:T9SS type A sorting domain-containing protein [Xanthomarina gelatinilytica]|uniref:T9SS type A sorting domain-containing protein n=1 Tax=Xanthomarina gelatinilytica TaxID=1137281 RepID=UPI003AA888E6